MSSYRSNTPNRFRRSLVGAALSGDLQDALKDAKENFIPTGASRSPPTSRPPSFFRPRSYYAARESSRRLADRQASHLRSNRVPRHPSTEKESEIPVLIKQTSVPLSPRHESDSMDLPAGTVVVQEEDEEAYLERRKQEAMIDVADTGISESSWMKGVQRLKSLDRLPGNYAVQTAKRQIALEEIESDKKAVLSPDERVLGLSGRSLSSAKQREKIRDQEKLKELRSVAVTPAPIVQTTLQPNHSPLSHEQISSLGQVAVSVLEPPEEDAYEVLSEEAALKISLEELQKRQLYCTSVTIGLSSSEAATRLEKFGANELPPPEKIPFWKAFLFQFTDPLILLLCISACISLGLQEYVDGAAIIIIVMINTLLAVVTESSADNALSALMSLTKPVATVIRDGERMTIPSREVVVGDIIRVETGDILIADARLLESYSLRVNEMLVTGETVDVNKKVSPTQEQVSKALVPPHLILSGTTCAGGYALALVISTGPQTRIGQLAAMLAGEADQDEDENEDKDDYVANQISPAPQVTTQLAQNSKVLENGVANGKIGDGTTTAEGIDEGKNEAKQKTGLRQAVLGKESETAMQKNISRLGLQVSVIAVVICICVFAVGMGRQQRNIDEIDQPVWLSMLLISVSLAVSAIPEGLPLAVTVGLALGSKRLAKSNALIRKLTAIENLGTVNVICTDKTGTLTAGQMTVTKLLLGGKEFDVSGRGFNPVGQITAVHQGNTRAAISSVSGDSNTGTDTASDLLLQSERQHVHSISFLALLCSNARLVQDEAGKWDVQGNSTEAPLVVLAAKQGLNADSPILSRFPRLLELPFSSESKMMLTLHQILAAEDNSSQSDVSKQCFLPLPSGVKYLTSIKGAPNFILPHCRYTLNDEGKVISCDQSQRDLLSKEVDRLAAMALRVLCIAYAVGETHPLEEKEKASGYQDDETLSSEQRKRESLLSQGLVFCGLVGSIDPEREGVADSIEVARGAGIETVMITGDYLETARAIGRKINLLNADVEKDPLCAIDCAKLRPNGEYLGNLQLDDLVSHVNVFARAQPRDKYYIVRSLQRQGAICAMTGDGVNDAPALKQADIGVAMGSGTSVAKGASQMVLVDDNFNTIIESVKIGRTIYNNIQKFVLLLLGSCATQIIIIAVCVIAGIPIALLPLQVLFINLATDGLSALALASNPGETDVMKYSPRPRNERMIHGFLWYLVGIHTLVLSCLLMLIYVVGLWLFSGSFLVEDIYPTDIPADDITCSVYLNAGNFEKTTHYGADCAINAYKTASSMAFCALGLCEIARGYTIRWYDHPFYYAPTSNIPLLCTSAFSICFLILSLYVPGLKDAFGTTFMPWYSWLMCIACVIVTVVIDEFVKVWVQNKRREAVEKEITESIRNAQLEQDGLEGKQHETELATMQEFKDAQQQIRAEFADEH